MRGIHESELVDVKNFALALLGCRLWRPLVWCGGGGRVLLGFALCRVVFFCVFRFAAFRCLQYMKSSSSCMSLLDPLYEISPMKKDRHRVGRIQMLKSCFSNLTVYCYEVKDWRSKHTRGSYYETCG